MNHNSPVMKEILESGFAAMDIPLPDGATEKYIEFYEHLVEQNRVMNLTALTGVEEAARLHFLDCAALLGAADFSQRSVIDVGTGAGFPGIPLRIARPDISLTLLDSLRKRVDFLEAACERLALDDVTCLHARAEDAPQLRESFDIAVSRAVARLDTLCELCIPFVRVGGLFLSMKGPSPADELEQAQNAISELGGELSGLFEYGIPETDVRHTVVIVKKIKATPEKYPRRFAKIQKSPL